MKIFKYTFILFSFLISSSVSAQPDTLKNEVWMQGKDIELYDYLGTATFLNQSPYQWDGDNAGRLGVGYKFIVNSTEEHDNVSIMKVLYRPEQNWSKIEWISHLNKNYVNEILDHQGNYRVTFIEWTDADEFIFLLNEIRVKAKILNANTLKILETN